MSDKSSARIAKFRDYSRVRYFDYILLGVVIMLLFFGLVMLYSSSAYTASIRYGRPTYYLRKQLLFIVLGFLVMLVAAVIKYDVLKHLVKFIYWGGVFLNIIVLFIGRSGNGSTRWIRVGGVQVQPSELMKIGIIIFFAYYISTHTESLGKNAFNIRILAYLFIATIFVFITNLTTAAIIAFIGFGMLLIASRNKKPLYALIIFALIVIAAAAFFVISKSNAEPGSYRLRRIYYWQHPEKATQNAGFQVLQGLYAIGSGGLFGKGIGASATKLGNLPESQNDMIFSVIVEELGVFGVACLILMYVLLLWRIYMIAVNAKDMFGSFLAIGVFLHLSVQVILNMLVVTNVLPNTGVTLPFISYGGSSLLCTMYEIGVVLSVSRQIRLDRIDLEEDF